MVWGALAATAGSYLGGKLFGGDNKTVQTQQLRKFTPEENRILQMMWKQFPGLLSAAQRPAGARGQDIGDQIYGVASKDINRQYDKAAGTTRFRAGLGGKGPASILAENLRTLNMGRSDSLSRARVEATSAGQQLGLGERSSDLAALQTLMGSYQGLWGTRGVGAGQTVTQPVDHLSPALSLGGLVYGLDYMNKDKKERLTWQSSDPVEVF